MRAGLRRNRVGDSCHRWYEQQTGRYTQPDPARSPYRLVDINPYVYVEGNPLVRTDPEGLATLGLGGGVWNFSDCCVLVSQNSSGAGQQQQWVKPGGIVLGLIRSDIDAVYYNDGSAVKIPDGEAVAIFSCDALSAANNHKSVLPPNSLRPGPFKSRVLPDRPAQEREFGGPILPPAPVCGCP